jgi:hypothetical protein
MHIEEKEDFWVPIYLSYYFKPSRKKFRAREQAFSTGGKI